MHRLQAGMPPPHLIPFQSTNWEECKHQGAWAAGRAGEAAARPTVPPTEVLDDVLVVKVAQ